MKYTESVIKNYQNYFIIQDKPVGIPSKKQYQCLLASVTTQHSVYGHTCMADKYIGLHALFTLICMQVQSEKIMLLSSTYQY